MTLLSRIETFLTPEPLRMHSLQYPSAKERTSFEQHSRPPFWMEIAAVVVIVAFAAGYLAGQVRMARHLAAQVEQPQEQH